MYPTLEDVEKKIDYIGKLVNYEAMRQSMFTTDSLGSSGKNRKIFVLAFSFEKGGDGQRAAKRC